ncbi:hypothetical protein AO738_25640 [Pseudomonas citronellolis]|nr:hypothetical protein AO742_23450 [Pseudomonas citronellolis]KRW74844.1 hypothetical protein AO738_25640 [Pseudomonas citronellolis]
MYGWFKRPLSVSPKASLPLLYKAVIEEVKETFPDFDAESDFEERNDLELMGGPYHILYDAFYVVVYNAAKHGKPRGIMKREFGIHTNEADKGGKVYIKISSEIKDDDNESLIAERLEVRSDADIENAHLEEIRSGIRKLYQLERADSCFAVDEISCMNRMVNIHLSYKLEHL